jgi:hypothetical protein
MKELTVHIRVTDAAHKPLPCRLRVVDEAGRFFAPFGRAADFPIARGEQVGGHLYQGNKKFVYIDGGCEIVLPTQVPLEVEVSAGLRYRPVQRTVTLGPGQMSLRFALDAWSSDEIHPADFATIDTRCHFLDAHSAALEAAAEGIDIVNSLALFADHRSDDGHLYRIPHGISSFSGQAVAYERFGSQVVVNTLNSHPALGRLAILHSHRPVYPLGFGGLDGSDDWSLNDWADQGHRKNGLVVWVDAFRPSSGLMGGEALLAAILGRIDAIECPPPDRSFAFLKAYERLWNAGVVLPLVGASGKDSNRLPVGAMRTLLPKSEAGSWVEAVRTGRGVVSNGPLLKMRYENNELVATAAGLQKIDKLELLHNGETIAKTSGTTEEISQANVSANIDESKGGWIAARCWSMDGGTTFAQTSPLRVGPTVRQPEAVGLLLGMIEATRDWAERDGVYQNEKWRAQLIGFCDEAKLTVDS